MLPVGMQRRQGRGAEGRTAGGASYARRRRNGIVQRVIGMLKTVCYNTTMKHKLACFSLCLALGATVGCGDDEPPTGGTGGRGGDAGPTGGMGGSGGTGGSGGAGGSGGTDGPVSETGPNPDGPSTDGPDSGGSPMGTVTPAGKRLVSADGRLILEIPPGAFIGPTDLTIRVVTASPPAGARGAVYEIDPVDEPLLVPARVIIRYSAADLGAGQPSDLRVGLRVGDSWLALSGNTADATNTAVIARLDKLGVVGLLPGLCSVCDATCTAENCKFGVTPETPAGVAGKCFDHGMGCKRCVPMCDVDGDGYCVGETTGGEPGGDCAAEDASRSPGAREVCGNGMDDDCDAHVDEGCKPCSAHATCTSASEACVNGVCDVCEGGCSASECFFGADEEMMLPGIMGKCENFGNGCNVCVPMCDGDGDGYCDEPNPGNAQPDGDCDDTNPFVAPGKKEICGNGVDDDCNGSIDDLCTDCSDDDGCGRDRLVCKNGACAACSQGCTPGAACNIEVDGNPIAGKCALYGRNDSCSRCVPMCDDDADGTCEGDPAGGEPGGDCARNNPDVHPNAIEICGNDEDDNCNSLTDEGCTRCTTHAQCTAPAACVDGTCQGCEAACVVADCRFGEMEGVPGSGVQGRCAAYATGCQRCVPMCDMDGDGQCTGAEPPNEQPGGDCDDTKADVYAGAPEICGNRIDDNCDGRKDEDCAVTTCSTSAACGASESCSTNR
jgi:hypothetical protein